MKKFVDNKLFWWGALVLLIIIGVILCFMNKNFKDTYLFLDGVNLEDLENINNGLLLEIKNRSIKCDAVKLEVYIDGTYKYYDTNLNGSNEEVNETDYRYDDPLVGRYDYDITKIFKGIKRPSDKTYIITTGKNEEYYTDIENKALKEFLDSINVNLDLCISVQVPEEYYKVKSIVYNSKENKNSCLEALEEIYKDDNYTYYLKCLKSEDIMVTYENGKTEDIKKAFKRGYIKVSDLDRFDIDYIKEEK